MTAQRYEDRNNVLIFVVCFCFKDLDKDWDVVPIGRDVDLEIRTGLVEAEEDWMRTMMRGGGCSGQERDKFKRMGMTARRRR